MTQKKVRIVFDLDTGQVSRRIGKVRQELGSLQKVAARTGTSIDKFGDHAKGAGHSLFNFVVIIGQARNAINNINLVTTGWVKSIIDTNREMEQLTQLMKGFSTATTEASRSQEALIQRNFLFDLAEKAPFALRATTDAFVKFKAAGIDPVKGGLKALIGAVANFGGTDQYLHRSAIAIQQMAGKGVISMEELRQQLGESVPTAIRTMADELKVSYATLVKHISNGEVKSNIAINAMLRGFERLYGHRAQEQMQTMNGQLAIFSTRMTKLRLIAGNGGFSDGLTSGMKELNKELSSPEFRQFALDLGRFLSDALSASVRLIKAMFEFKEVIVDIGIALTVAFASRVIFVTMRNFSLSVIRVSQNISQFRTNVVGYRAAMDTVDKTLQNANRTAGKNFGFINQTSAAWSKLGETARIAAAKQAKAAIFGAIVGPLMTVITILTTVAATWLLIRNNANQAFDSMVRGVNYFNGQKDANKAKDAIDEEANAIEKLIRKRKNLLENPYRQNTLTGGDGKQEAGKLQSEIAMRIKNLETAKQNYTKSLIKMEEEEVARFEETSLEQVAIKKATLNRIFKAEVQAARDKLNLANGEGGKINDKQFADAQVAAAKKQSDDYITILKDRIALEKKIVSDNKLNKNAISGASRTILTLKSMVAKEVAAAEQDYKNTLSGALFGDGEKSSVQFGKALTTMIKSARVQLAGEQAKLSGGNEDLARAKMKIIAATGLEKKSNDELQAIYLRLNVLIGETKDKYNNLADSKRDIVSADKANALATEKMNSLLITARDKYAQLTGALSHPAVARINKEYLTFTKRINDLVAKQKALAATNSAVGDSWKKLESDGKNIAALFQGAQMALLTQTIGQETQTIYDGLATQKVARQNAYNSEVARLNSLLTLHRGTAEERAALEVAVTNNITALRAKLDRENRGALQKYAEDMGDFSDKVESSFTGLLDGFINDLADGKASFASFAKSILKSLIKIIIKALIAKAILSMIGGSSGGSAPNMKTTSMGLNYNAGIGTGVYHAGGIIGSRSPASRMVPSSMFDSAKKYHTGGVIGKLNSSEVPIIGQRGEGVFTADQMKALGAGLSSPKVELNIINQSGTPLTGEQSGSRMDATKMVVDIVVEAIGRPGPMRDAVRTAR